MSSRASDLKAFMAMKKKQTKNDTSQQQYKSQLQGFLEDNNEAKLIEMSSSFEPKVFVESVLGETMLKTRMLVEAIKYSMMKFIVTINDRLGKQSEFVNQYLNSKENEAEGTKIINSIVKSLVEIIDSKKQFVQILKNQFKKTHSLFSILTKYMNFDEIKFIILQSKHITYFASYLLQICQFHQLNPLTEQFSQFLRTCKNEQSWKTQQFSKDEDISVYTLEHISYNILHHFANKMNSGKFFQFLTVAEPELVNQFNNLNETPIDVVLRLFPLSALDELFKIVEENRDIMLSMSSLNNLLENKNLINESTSLLKYVRLIKGLEKRGFIDQLWLKTGGYDTIEYCDVKMLLVKLDKYNRFPLLKYITFFKNHNLEIVSELLPYNIKNQTDIYQSRLKLNSFYQLIKSSSISKQIDIDELKPKSDGFDIYTKQLIEQAFKCADEELITFLLKQINIPNVFTHSMGSGSDFTEHILIKAIKKSLMNNLVKYLIDVVFNGALVIKHLELSQQNCFSIKKRLGGNVQKVSKYQTIIEELKNRDLKIMNELFYSYFEIQHPKNTDNHNLIKQKFKKHYSQHSEDILDYVFRNSTKKYICHKMFQIFKPQEILNFVVPHQKKLLKAIIPDAFQAKSPILSLLSNEKLFSVLKEIINILADEMLQQNYHPSFKDFYTKYNIQKRWKILTELFIKHNKHSHVVDYFIQLMKKYDSIGRLDCNILFDDKTVDDSALQKLVTNFLPLMTEMAYSRLNRENNQVCKKILKYRTFGSYCGLIKLKNFDRFKEEYEDFKKLCIDFTFQVLDKKLLIQSIKSMNLDQFQKDTILRMIKDNSTFFNQILRSDDIHLQKIKKFIHNDLSNEKFINIIKSYNQRSISLKIFVISNETCNYLIIKYLQQYLLLKKQKVWNQIAYNITKDQDKILPIIAYVSNEKIRNQIFQKVISYPKNLLVQNEGDQNNEEQYQFKIKPSHVVSLISKLNVESINAIEAKFFEVFQKNTLDVLYQMVGIVSNSKIAELFQKVFKIDDNDLANEQDFKGLNSQYQQNQIKSTVEKYLPLLKKVIEKQSDQINYKRILIKIKPYILKQIFESLEFSCLKELVYWHPDLAYKIIFEDLVELKEKKNLHQIYDTIRFTGHIPLTFFLLFVLQIENSTIVLYQNKVRLKYKFSKSIIIFLNSQHFKLYINEIMKIVYCYPEYKENLTSISILLAQNEMYEKLSIMLTTIKGEEYAAGIIDQIFKITTLKQITESGKKCMDLVYSAMKQVRKSIDDFEVFKSIYRQKREVLQDYPSLNINILDFISLLEIDSQQQSLLRYQQNVKIEIEAQGLDNRANSILRRPLIRKMLGMIHPLNVSKPNYETVLNNWVFVINYLNTRTENAFYWVTRKMGTMIIETIDQKKQFSKYYAGVQFTYFPRVVLSSKVIQSLQNYMLLFPNFLDDDRNRHFFLKFGRRQLVSKYVTFFKPQDLKQMVIYANDIEIFKKFAIKLSKEQVRKGIVQNMYRFLYDCQQQFIIKMIEQYNLYKQITTFDTINQTSSSHIFRIIISKNLFKLFNTILEWASKSGADINQQMLQSIQHAEQYSFYEYKYIPNTLFNPEQKLNFSSSTRFYRDQDIVRSIESTSFLHEFVVKLKNLLAIKKILTQPQGNIISAPVYTFDLHHILLNIVFQLNNQPINSKNLSTFEAYTYQFLICIKLLLAKEIAQGELKELKSSLLLILMLYCNTSNKQTITSLKEQYPHQVSTCQTLCNIFGKTINFPNHQKLSFVSFFLSKSIVLQSSIIEFIFKYYPKQIIHDLTTDIMIQYNQHIFYLLAQFNRQQHTLEPHSVYNKALPQIKEVFKMKYGQVLILNWCCFQNLRMDLEELLEEIKDQHISTIGVVLKFIEENLQGQSDDKKDEGKGSQQLLNIIFKRFQPTLTIDKNIVKDILSGLSSLNSKYYINLSLLNIYLTLTTIQSQVYKQFLLFPIKILVNLHPSSPISFSQDQVLIHSQTKISVSKIIFLESYILFNTSHAHDQIQDMLWITFNTSYLQNILDETVAKLMQSAVKTKVTEFQNLQLVIDFQSFKNVSGKKNKERIFFSESVDRKNILSLKKIFQDIIYSIKVEDVFNYDDMAAPHCQNEVIMIEYYKLLVLPKAPIQMRYISDKEMQQLHESQNKTIFEDVQKYYRYFYDTMKGKDVSNNKFNYQINYSFSENKNVVISTSLFSFYNITRYFSLMNKFQYQILSSVKNLNIKLNFLTLIQLLKLLSPISLNVLDTLSKFLSNKNFLSLCNYICLSIFITTPHISSSILGLRFNFKLVKQRKQEGYLIMKNPDWRLYRVNYEGMDPVIDVVIEMSVGDIDKEIKFEEMVLSGELERLFDEKQFVECVFATPEKLTNYYVNRNNLDNQVVILSKSLTEEFDRMVNVSIDYKSLYDMVKKIGTRDIPMIERILTQLASKLVVNVKNRILETRNSDNTINLYNTLLHKKAYEINNKQFYSKYPDQLVYTSKNTNYIKKVNTLKELANVKWFSKYFIQIYKSYVSNTFVLKNKYLLGYKNKTINYKVVSHNDFSNIDFNDISYVLMISKTIPDEQILPKDKILKIAVNDMANNLHLIDNLKEYLMETPQSIFEFVPIINSQYNVIFTKKGEACVADQGTIQCSFDSSYNTKVQQIKGLSVLPADQLREIIEPLVDSFFSNAQIEIVIRVSFDTKENIHDVEYFAKAFELYMSILQRSIKQYYQDTTQFYVLEMASIAFPHDNLKDGYLKMKKKQLLQNYLKQIHIRVGKLDNQKITIADNQMRVYLNCIVGKPVKLDQNIVIEQLSNWINRHEGDRLKVKVQHNSHQNLLVMYELQVKTVELVKRIYPKYKYEIKILSTDKKELSCNDTDVTIGINQNKIYSFEEILVCMLQVRQQNCHLIEYENGTILLNMQLNYVTETIIVPIDTSKQVSIQKIKLEKVSEIKVNVPEDSIYIIVGSSLLWNKTSKDVKLDKSIVGVQGSKIKLCIDLKTKENVVTDFTKCTILCKNIYKNSSSTQSVHNITSNERMLTRNMIEFTLKNDLKCLTTAINPPKPQLPYNYVLNQNITVQISSVQGYYVPKTKFISILLKNKKQSRINIDQVQNQLDDNFAEPTTIKQQNQVFLSKEQIIKASIQQIKNSKPLNIANTERKHLSLAGVTRVDRIILCDQQGSEITVAQYPKMYFQYGENAKIKIVPQITINNQILDLQWTPTVRGRYDLVIDGMIVPHNHEIAVTAAEIDLKAIKLSLPKQTTANYCQWIKFQCEYKDIYGNTFGQLEESINPEAILLQAISQDTNSLKLKTNKIDLNGVQTGLFMDDNMTSDVKKDIDVKFMFMKQFIANFKITINGLPLKKRQQFFNKELEKANKKRNRTLNVKRKHFLEGLLSHVDQDLNVVYGVVFENEPGIDAGGLKRQFYDMVGAAFKNQKHQFFKPILKSKARYTFHPNILKNKRKQLYLRCFGKFLANSILNGYFIGVDFAETFVKALYNTSVTFQDLKEVLEPSVFERYEYLRTLAAEEFEDMYLSFNLVQGKEQKQLIEGGKNIAVRKDNVEDYLAKIAEYELYKRYQSCYKAFFNGFQQVFSFKLIEKSFKPNQFHILTCGLHEVTPQVVLEILVFPYQAPNQISWFKRYISEASQQILQKFLKFTTGSSSLPFDLASTKLSIEFMKMGNNPQKLPISHTCYKSIEIPTYSTYEIMEKKLNVAFLYASEGFGFG